MHSKSNYKRVVFILVECI